MIVRSADFYGQGAVQSFTHVTVFERIKVGQTPQWICNPDAIHTFTYTPDAGATLAVLGSAPEA